MPYRTPSQKLVGDPGIFGTLGKIFGTGLKVAGTLVGGPIGIGLRAGAGLLGGTTRPGTPTFVPPVMPGGRKLLTFGEGAVPRAKQPGVALGAVAGRTGRRRRMDPMNVKALRRATRRLAAFDREKKKVEKQLRAIAPRPARRSRRDAPPGHTHVR